MSGLSLRELMRALPDVLDNVEHFQHRVLQDALQEATASYWLRRAGIFQSLADSRPGCREIAQACRNRAAVALLQDGEAPAAIVCITCGTPTSPWTCSCGETRLPEVA